MSPTCIQDLVGIHDWLSGHSLAAADAWLEGVTADLESLAVFPKRCGVAPESIRIGKEMRQLISGGYRIVFSVEGRCVTVHFVRHCARLPRHMR